MNISREYTNYGLQKLELVGFDIDEILLETIDAALIYHNFIIGNKKVCKEDITDYHFHKIPSFGVTQDYSVNEWFGKFIMSDKVDTIQPVAGAKEFLEKIIQTGYMPVSITARPDKYMFITYKALTKYYSGLLYDIAFANTYSGDAKTTTKAILCHELCKKYNTNMKFMVEDDLFHARNIADSGIKVYLLPKPWNKQYINGTHPYIIKVQSRQDILLLENI